MLLLILGFALVILIMVDVLWTTLTTLGSGMLTRPLTKSLHWLTRSLNRLSSRRPLALTGPLSIVLLGLFWVLGLWLGWLMVFIGLEEHVVVSKTGEPADLAGYIYFVGFTLSTLGVGDLYASGGPGRVLTSVAAFNGLVMVTLGITYAVPLVSGSVQRRKLAFSISMLGCNPAEIVARSWNGQDFKALESMLSSLSSDLIQNAEQRLAYPVLDHFHTRDPEFSLGLQLVILDETMSLLTFGLAKSHRPDPTVLSNARRAIGHYLTRVSATMAPIEAEVPPLPSLELLAPTGLPLKSDDEFTAAMAELNDRRRLLHQLILYDGWDWSRVHQGETDSTER